MTKKFLTLLLTMALLLCGCSLAQEDTGAETGTDASDKLIGAVITLEHLDLFDFEAYLNDNLSQVMNGGVIEGDTSAYEGRIYATRVESDDPHDVEYVFEGIDGYAVFSPTIYGEDPRDTYISIIADPGINDIKNGVHSINEDVQEQSIEATIYVANDMDNYQFFLNPVFQDAEGRIYLVAGHSFSTNHMGQSSMSTTSEYTTTIDGVETTYHGSVCVTFQGVPRPEKIVVLQMDADSHILSREEYAPGALPAEITPADGTDYFLVETHSAEGITRELFGRDSTALKTYIPMENGVCDAVMTTILWEE